MKPLTKTQEKNAQKLLGCIESYIRCDDCGAELGGYVDDVTISEEAAVDGWKVDRNGNPKCEKCK